MINFNCQLDKVYCHLGKGFLTVSMGDCLDEVTSICCNLPTERRTQYDQVIQASTALNSLP